MCIFYEFFQSSLCAEWATALGTILLALATFIIILTGDNATRLMRRKLNYDFQMQLYNFLKKIINDPQNAENESVSFYNEIISNKIYLSWCNDKKLRKYLLVALNLSKAWGNDEITRPLIREVLDEKNILKKTLGVVE